MGRRYRNLGTLDGISIGPHKTETMRGIGFLERDGEAWLPGVGTPRGIESEPPWKTAPSYTTDTQTGLTQRPGSCQGHKHSRNNPGSAPSTAVTAQSSIPKLGDDERCREARPGKRLSSACRRRSGGQWAAWAKQEPTS